MSLSLFPSVSPLLLTPIVYLHCLECGLTCFKNITDLSYSCGNVLSYFHKTNRFIFLTEKENVLYLLFCYIMLYRCISRLINVNLWFFSSSVFVEKSKQIVKFFSKFPALPKYSFIIIPSEFQNYEVKGSSSASC